MPISNVDNIMSLKKKLKFAMTENYVNRLCTLNVKFACMISVKFPLFINSEQVRIYKRWIPESYLDNYITSFNPEWSFHQKHLTGHFTMNYYNPWNATFVQDSGIYSLHGEAFGNPSFKQVRQHYIFLSLFS